MRSYIIYPLLMATGLGFGWLLGSKGLDLTNPREALPAAARLARKDAAPLRQVTIQEDTDWKAACRQNPKSVLARLRSMGPLDRNSLLTALLEDEDLLFAQELLESDLAEGLPRELFARAAGRALEQDEKWFLAWARRTLEGDTATARTLLSLTPVGYPTTKDTRRELLRLWLQGIARHPDVPTEDMTAYLLLTSDLSGALAGGLSLKMSGNAAPQLAQRLGALYPGEADRFVSAKDTALRAEFLRGAASSDTPPPAVEGPEAETSRIRGEWDRTLRTGEPSENAGDLVRGLLRTVPEKGMDRLIHETLKSRLDPSWLLTELTTVREPAADAFAERLLTKIAQSDLVEATRLAAAMPSVPDGAIRTFLGEIQKDPEASLLWASRLSDPAEREKTSQQILGEAEKTDPALAEKLRAGKSAP